ncbi:MAG: hypothetical protein IJ512_06460 [Ruminococcus sp.]|nr:hypothetical protein [Ruminococcus sp.]
MMNKKTFLQKAISFVTAAALIMTIGIILPQVSEPIQASALTSSEITQKMTALQSKYPAGKYWNHVSGEDYDGFSVSSTPCGTNGYTCNKLYSGSQCFAFARQMALEVFGSYPAYGVSWAEDLGTVSNGWTAITDPSKVTLEPGDIIRSDYNSHSAMIWKIEGEKVYVAQCFGGVGCKINWGTFWGDHNLKTVSELLGPGFNGVWKHPDSTIADIDYEAFSGTYYLKNKSTGTYMHLEGSDANKSNIGAAAKQETDAFKMVITPIKSGDPDQGHYIVPKGCTRAVNPYATTPTSGTNVTLYDKTTDGQQYWLFEPVDGGYIIHNKWNQNLVLNVSGSNVNVTTNTGAASQIWTLEKADVTLSSIAIDPDSIGTIYEEGCPFDFSTLCLTATYSDGTTKTLTTGYVAQYHTNTHTLTVTYEDKTTTLDITVQDLFEGSGTESDPYRIGTDEDLKNLADMVNLTAANPCYGKAYYKQTADIDLGLYDWKPIGWFYANEEATSVDNRAAFYGHYDGNYHKITNLKMDYAKKYAGLFGRVNGDAVVENLSVQGTVASSTWYAGGIIGELGHGGTIRNCDFSGTVTGECHVGAIAGKIYRGGTISSCYANAAVTATAEEGIAGGILSIAQINATDDTVAITVENCCFAGKVNASVNGGVVAQTVVDDGAAAALTIHNSYYLNSASSGTEQHGCMSLISSQLKTIAADLGSPYVDNPYSTLNDGYPVFEWQLLIEGDVNADGVFSVADAVMLQKWILNIGEITDWYAGDLCKDEKLNALDLCAMKRALRNG